MTIYRLAFSIIALTLTLILVAIPRIGQAADATNASDWLQWRGPNRDGHVPSASWPDSVDESHLNRVWRVALGPSYSGPIVAGGRIFVTETRDQKHEVVKAIDRASGTVLWETQWNGTIEVPGFARRNGSWIRATPACDGETLYVAGMRDLLVALDVNTGDERWRVDFAERFSTPVPSFGCASSPLVIGEYIYMQAGGGFTKLDKRTGETVWQVLRDGGGMMDGAFSSPYWSENSEAAAAILVQTRSALASVDPADGDVLWQRPVEAFRGMNILTPTVATDGAFTGAYGGRSLLLATDEENPGEVATLWENPVQPYMSSPVVVDGNIYLHLRNRRFTCIDASTGETRWTTTPFGEYWSMLTNGRDKILALDQRGIIYLIRANPQRYDQLDERQITDSETWAHLAISESEVFIRELDGLSVYSWTSSVSQATDVCP